MGPSEHSPRAPVACRQCCGSPCAWRIRSRRALRGRARFLGACLVAPGGGLCRSGQDPSRQPLPGAPKERAAPSHPHASAALGWRGLEQA